MPKACIHHRAKKRICAHSEELIAQCGASSNQESYWEAICAQVDSVLCLFRFIVDSAAQLILEERFMRGLGVLKMNSASENKQETVV